MKRLILLLFIFFNLILTVVNASELSVYSQLHLVGGVNGKIPCDYVGNKCAKITVSMPYGGKDVDIECTLKVGDVEKGVGSYSFWVSPPKSKGKQSFTIRTNEFLPLSIDIWTTEGQLIGGQVYEVVINVPEKNVNKKTPVSKNCDFTLSTQNLSIWSSGGTKSIFVGGSLDWYIEMPKSEWLTVSKSKHEIIVSASNNTTQKRTDSFFVVCGNNRKRVTVFQNADNVYYKTFILPVFGFSLKSQPSVGLMVGGIKDCGWYLKGRTGFYWPYNKEINIPNEFDDGFFFTDEVKKSDLSITGGFSKGLGKSPFCLNFGLGYEDRMVLQKSHSGEWVRISNDSYKGMVLECMLLFLLDRNYNRLTFSWSAGFSKLLPGDYSTVELCFGVNF